MDQRTFDQTFNDLFQVLSAVQWPDLEVDTVLNIWLQRQALSPAGYDGEVTWSWPRYAAFVQGDTACASAVGPAVQQAMRQALPRSVAGVTFRADLRAGGKLDGLFHASTYTWRSSDDPADAPGVDSEFDADASSRGATAAFAAAAQQILQRVAWPKRHDSAVLNYCLVRQAPSVSLHELECDWPRCRVQVQGDRTLGALALQADAMEALLEAMPEDASVIEFRIEVSAEGEVLEPAFHVTTWTWSEELVVAATDEE